MDITTKKSRAELQSYFKKNCIPTENQFEELIEVMLNQQDDGIVKLPENPLCIEADQGSSKNVLKFYQDFDSTGADWTFSLNLGFNISDSEGNSRLFIDQETGNIGINTTQPVAKLDIQLAVRSGDHPSSVKGLYITGDFGTDSDGIEFRHNNGTQGIGFGYNTIYATGSNANQDLALKARGTGQVNVTSTLQADTLQANKYVIQNGVDGGNTKGIWMWQADDPNWGIYMSQAGPGKSLAGGAAVGGQGFDGYSIRFRTFNAYGDEGGGLIYENSDEKLNFSVRAKDGLASVRGGMQVGEGGTKLQRIIAGSVNSSGTKTAGSGFDSSRQDLGKYQVYFHGAFASAPIIVATCNNNDGDDVITATAEESKSTITIFDVDTSKNANYQDGSFSFIAIGVVTEA